MNAISRLTALLLLCVLLISPVAADQPAASLQTREQSAEAAYREGDYSKAFEIYLALQGEKASLSTGEQSRIACRLADCLWRSGVSSGDVLKKEQGLQGLQQLEVQLAEDRHRSELWVQVEESLAEYYILAEAIPEEKSAWDHWQQALGYWETSQDIAEARTAYMGIVRRAVSLLQQRFGEESSIFIPQQILLNVLQIADNDTDRAMAHFYLAEQQRGESTVASRLQELEGHFLAAIEGGRGASWFNRALFLYAEWLERSGSSYYNTNGEFLVEPDYEKALDVYRRLCALPGIEQSPYYARAAAAIDRIERPRLEVRVDHAYHPETEMECSLIWRNMDAVNVAIYPVSIVENMMVGETGGFVLPEQPESVAPIRSISLQSEAEKPHYRVQRTLKLGQDLPSGAYFVQATGGGITASGVLLVSNTAVLLKTAPGEVLAYVCNASGGEPVPDADVLVWMQNIVFQDGNRIAHVYGLSGRTDASGVAHIRFARTEKQLDEQFFWVGAVKGAEQAYATAYESSAGALRSRLRWTGVAFSDQDIYAPGGAIRWKALLRHKSDLGYEIPPQTDVTYALVDQAGQRVLEGVARTSDYGTVQGTFNLPASLPVGTYFLEVAPGNDSDSWFKMTSFQVRNYAATEYNLQLDLNTGAHRGGIVASGDAVHANLSVTGRSGNSVANAEVRVVVYEQPFDASLMSASAMLPDEGAVVQQQVLVTDSRGMADFSFTVPHHDDVDYLYGVQAFVRDASGNETIARDRIIAARQGYYVALLPGSLLNSADNPMNVRVHTWNASSDGCAAKGSLRLTRQRWREIWVDRSGREISGEEMRRLEENSDRWFSFGPSPSDYRLEEEGYINEEVQRVRLTTDKDGKVEHSFDPLEPGYYVLSWFGRDNEGRPVRSSSAFWVSRSDTTSMGYRPEGIQLVLDPSGVNAGEPLPLLVATEVKDRWVLLTTGAERLQSWQVFKMPGTAAYLPLDLEASAVPNTYVEASFISEDALFSDRKMVPVALPQKALSVQVETDALGYEPGEEATFTFTVTDEEGQPLPNTELAFSLTDAGNLQGASLGMLSDFSRFAAMLPYAVSETASLNLLPFYKPLQKEDEDHFAILSSEAVQPVSEGHSLIEASRSGLTGKDSDSLGGLGAVYWNPQLKTDAQGKATVTLTLPKSIALWQARVQAVSGDSRIGVGYRNLNTRLPLTAHLQIPATLVQGDETVATVSLGNNTLESLLVDTVFSHGALLVPIQSKTTGLQVQMPPKSNRNLLLQLQSAQQSGGGSLEVVATGDTYVDTSEAAFHIVPRGNWVSLNEFGRTFDSGKIFTWEQSDALQDTSVALSLSPGLAPLILNTTVSRMADEPVSTEAHLGTALVMVNAALRLTESNYATDAVLKKLFPGEMGGVDALTGRFDSVLATHSVALATNQNADGGWSWAMNASGETENALTAYILWGLTLLRESGVAVDENMLRKARYYLTRALIEQELTVDTEAAILRALSMQNRRELDNRPSRVEARAIINLLRRQDELDPIGISMLALAARDYGLSDEALQMLRLLEVAALRNEDGTVSWPAAQNGFWKGNAVESTVWAVNALISVDSGNALIEPAINYILSQQQSHSGWGSGRCNVLVARTLADYIELNGDATANLSWRVFLNDNPLMDLELNRSNLLSRGSDVYLPQNLLRSGKNTLRVVRKAGQSAAWFYAFSFRGSAPTPIAAASDDSFSIERTCYRLHQVPTLLRGYVARMEPLDMHAPVEMGDQIEVVLRIRVDRPVDYLTLQETFPAGFEPIRIRDGVSLKLRRLKQTPTAVSYTPGADIAEWLEDETRFEEASLPLSVQLNGLVCRAPVKALEPGIWELSYRLRAETPGVYHFLPAILSGVYSGSKACTEEFYPLSVQLPQE
ncbi:MAG: hypothetical protein JW739_01835 [Opitutales bacterium]|nr:hypothetical protein [Opitutales bacterium]